VLSKLTEQASIPEGSSVSIARLIYPDPTSPENLIPENTFTLSGDIQTGINAAADDLPFEIIWVDEYSEFTFEETSESGDVEGMLILLGNLNPMKVDILQVVVTIYYADKTNQSFLVNLDRRSGSWEVVSMEIFG
jgi:hypothetical protein